MCVLTRLIELNDTSIRTETVISSSNACCIMSKRHSLKEIHRSPPSADELTSVWHREDQQATEGTDDAVEAAGSNERSDLPETAADD